MLRSNCEFGMTNPKGYFRVGRRKAALGVSGDRVPWGKIMGFTKAAEKWKTGTLIQAYERVELTGLWVHGVMERKKARVKLRILHRNAFLSRTVTPARTSHTSIECVLAHNLLTGISHNLEQKDRVKERDSCEHGGNPPNPLLKFSHTH